MKIKYFSLVVVALILGFSACNKEVQDQIVDEEIGSDVKAASASPFQPVKWYGGDKKSNPDFDDTKYQADIKAAVSVGEVKNQTRSNASGLKITSNAHSADFPGIYFVWDTKQKDAGILKVGAKVFEVYDYFILTSKESDNYWDFKIEPKAGGINKDGDYLYFIPKIVEKDSKGKFFNINMVFIDVAKLKNCDVEQPILSKVSFWGWKADTKGIFKKEVIYSQDVLLGFGFDYAKALSSYKNVYGFEDCEAKTKGGLVTPETIAKWCPVNPDGWVYGCGAKGPFDFYPVVPCPVIKVHFHSGAYGEDYPIKPFRTKEWKNCDNQCLEDWIKNFTYEDIWGVPGCVYEGWTLRERAPIANCPQPNAWGDYEIFAKRIPCDGKWVDCKCVTCTDINVWFYDRPWGEEWTNPTGQVLKVMNTCDYPCLSDFIAGKTYESIFGKCDEFNGWVLVREGGLSLEIGCQEPTLNTGNGNLYFSIYPKRVPCAGEWIGCKCVIEKEVVLSGINWSASGENGGGMPGIVAFSMLSVNGQLRHNVDYVAPGIFTGANNTWTIKDIVVVEEPYKKTYYVEVGIDGYVYAGAIVVNNPGGNDDSYTLKLVKK